jgi:hypothetical protein
MWPLIAGAITAPIIGGLSGNISASEDADEARRMRQKAIEKWNELAVPSIQDQQLSLSRFQNAGAYNPNLEQTHNQVSTSFNNIKTDPFVWQAQYQALRRLQDISSQGGMTAEDKDRQFQIHAENARQEKAQRGAITQSMAARGLGGSGMEIASQLQSQQSGANRNAEQSMGVQAMAQKRALQAMMGSGELAGQMERQQFGEQAEAAKAQDMINQFNTRNQQGVAGTNVDRMNQGQQLNLGNSQDISNRNTDISNREQIHNKSLHQQSFDNQTRIAAGVSGQYNNAADADLAEAQRKRAMWGGMGQGVGQAAAAYGMYGRGNGWMRK